MLFDIAYENTIIQMEKEKPADFSLLDWNAISSYHYLSHSFMDRYFDKLHKNIICSAQRLSEKFIRKHIYSFSDKELKIISNSQAYNLSDDFVNDFMHKLDMRIICKHRKFQKFNLIRKPYRVAKKQSFKVKI